MERYEGLKDMLKDELTRIEKKGELNEQTLGHVDKITHALKCLETIQAMEDSGYSEHYPGPMMPMPRNYYDDGGSYGYAGGSYGGGSYGGGSYARGRGSRASRDSMGRYSSESRRSSYDESEDMRDTVHTKY